MNKKIIWGIVIAVAIIILGITVIYVISYPKEIEDLDGVINREEYLNKKSSTTIVDSTSTSTQKIITEQDLKNGWYYGNLDQMKVGTPVNWIHIGDGTKSAMWKAPVMTQQITTSDWKTYTDSTFKLEMKYPSSWTQTSDAKGDPRYNVAFYYRKNQTNGYEQTNNSVHIDGNEDCATVDTKGWKTDNTLKYVKRVCLVEKRLLITLIASDEVTQATEDSMLSSIKFTSPTNTNTSNTQPSITVLSPNGGERYNINTDPLSASWVGTNLPSGDGIQFSLVGANGNVIVANAMGTGLVLKAAGGSVILNPGSIQSGNYRLRITDNYGNTDMSDNYFTITN
jgi:hypothetical protein